MSEGAQLAPNPPRSATPATRLMDGAGFLSQLMAWLVCILSKQNRQEAARKVHVADVLAADIGSIAAMITTPLACFVGGKRIQRRVKCRETVSQRECGRVRGQPAGLGSPR